MPRPPRYEWDLSLSRYRDRQTGRLVADSQVRQAIDAALRNATKQMRTLSDDLRAGRISREAWAVEMRQQVSDVQIFSGAAARGGFKNLDGAAYRQIGSALSGQERFLDGFIGQVQRGELPIDGAFTRRSMMYAQAGRGTFSAIHQTVQAEQGFTEEKNILDPLLSEGAHCVTGENSCQTQSNRGWVPLGSLVPIGQRLCLTGCRCRIIYRAVA